MADNNTPLHIAFEVDLPATLAKAEKCDRLSVMIAPHAPYSCSEANMRRAAELSKEYNLPITIHLAETHDEERQILERFGCDNLNTLFCTLNIRQNIHPFPLFIRDPRTRPSERGCARPFIQFCIIPLFLFFCKRFFKNISSFFAIFFTSGT